jgi:hypothetical protein
LLLTFQQTFGYPQAATRVFKAPLETYPGFSSCSGSIQRFIVLRARGPPFGS